MERRIGNTTRLADKYIQGLFTNGSCTCLDHHGTNITSLLLMDIVLGRLCIEHKLEFNKDFTINRNKYFIKLIS